MAFLTLDGTTVAVALDSLRYNPFAVGEAGASGAGQWRSSVRRRPRNWQVATTPLNAADADTLLDLLDGASRTAAGDFAEDAPLSVRAVVESMDSVRAAGGVRFVVKFSMWEV